MYECAAVHPLIALCNNQLFLCYDTEMKFLIRHEKFIFPSRNSDIYHHRHHCQPHAEDNKKSINVVVVFFFHCQYVYRGICLIIYYHFLIDFYFHMKFSKRFYRPEGNLQWFIGQFFVVPFFFFFNFANNTLFFGFISRFCGTIKGLSLLDSKIIS